MSDSFSRTLSSKYLDQFFLWSKSCDILPLILPNSESIHHFSKNSSSVSKSCILSFIKVSVLFVSDYLVSMSSISTAQSFMISSLFYLICFIANLGISKLTSLKLNLLFLNVSIFSFHELSNDCKFSGVT